MMPPIILPISSIVRPFLSLSPPHHLTLYPHSLSLFTWKMLLLHSQYSSHVPNYVHPIHYHYYQLYDLPTHTHSMCMVDRHESHPRPISTHRQPMLPDYMPWVICQIFFVPREMPFVVCLDGYDIKNKGLCKREWVSAYIHNMFNVDKNIPPLICHLT